MRRPATLCAALTFGLHAQFAPLVPARAVDGALDPTFGTLRTNGDCPHFPAGDTYPPCVGFGSARYSLGAVTCPQLRGAFGKHLVRLAGRRGHVAGETVERPRDLSQNPLRVPSPRLTGPRQQAATESRPVSNRAAPG